MLVDEIKITDSLLAMSDEDDTGLETGDDIEEDEEDEEEESDEDDGDEDDEEEEESVFGDNWES